MAMASGFPAAPLFSGVLKTPIYEDKGRNASFYQLYDLSG